MDLQVFYYYLRFIFAFSFLCYFSQLELKRKFQFLRWLAVIIASVLLMCYSVKLMETSALDPHRTSGNSSLLSPNAVISDYVNIIRIAQPSKAFIRTYGNKTCQLFGYLPLHSILQIESNHVNRFLKIPSV